MKMNFEQLKNRVKTNFKKNRIAILIFAVIWVLTIVLTLRNYDKTLGMESVGNESFIRSIQELNKNTVVVQTADIEEDAESVSILFATYARSNRGNIHILVEGTKTGDTYAEETVSVDQIQDNAYYTISLAKKLSKKTDDKLKITLTSDSEPGEAIAVYYSEKAEERPFEFSLLTINDKAVEEGDLSMRYLVHDDNLSRFSKSVIAWMVTGLTIMFLYLFLFEPKWENFFTAFVLILGLIFMIIIVPMSPPDEQRHYELTLRFSNTIMMKENVNTIDDAYLNYGSMYGHYNISAGYQRFLKQFNQPMELKNHESVIGSEVGITYMVQYIPQALGITLGRLLNRNMITTFYLGRMVNLLFYAACVYITIKKAPAYKFLFGMISSMPMFIQTGASLSYDVFNIGLSMVSLAYFLKWYFEDKKIEIKDYLFVLIVCAILAPAKVVYGFFAFLFWFVPSNRFGGTKQKIVLTGMLCLSAGYQLYDIMRDPLDMCFDAIKDYFEAKSASDKVTAKDLANNIYNAFRPLINVFKEADDYVEESYSFSYVFAHPVDTLMIFARTVRFKIKTWFYASLGRYLSGETLVLPLLMTHIMTAIMLSSAIVKQDITLPPYLRIINILICVVIGLYIMGGFFVTWTNMSQVALQGIDGNMVEGVQGRYFCPLLPYFFTAIPNKKYGIPEKWSKYVVCAYILLFFEVVIYVLSYTFVN